MFGINAATTYPPHVNGEYLMNLYASTFMDPAIHLDHIKEFVRWCGALSSGEAELPAGLDQATAFQVAAFASAGAAAAYNARTQVRVVMAAANDWIAANPPAADTPMENPLSAEMPSSVN